MSQPTPEVHDLLLGEGGMGLEASAFEAWCAAHAAARCRLWLGAEAERTLLAEPGARFADRESLAAYARRVLGHYEHAADDALVAGWRSGPRTGASLLLPPADLAALAAAAARHAVHLEGVHPLWAGALAWVLHERPALVRDAWLLVVQGRVVTALELRGGAIVQLRRHWLETDEAAGLGWLAEELSAPGRPLLVAGFGLGGTPPPALRVQGRLDGDGAEFVRQLGAGMPESRRPWSARLSPDFTLHPQPQRPFAGWALAATGALVLALAASEAWDAYAQWRQAQTPVSGATAGAPRRPAPPRTANATVDEDAAALDRLAYPWERIFGASEAATPRGGAWLAFEHRAAQPTLRLGGQAPGLEAALAVAAAMARAPDLADATLARSEARDGGTVQFDIVARVGARRAP